MTESKHYYDFTNELSADEIYEGLLAHGLFTEKLPPVFTAKAFYDYCKSQSPAFPKKPAEYIYHEMVLILRIISKTPIIRCNWCSFAQCG